MEFPLELKTNRSPEFAEPYYHLGLLLLRDKRYPEALDVLTRLDALEPENAENLRLLARAHARNNDHATAVELFRRAIELDPGPGPQYRRLGRALIALGRNDEAVAPLEHAERLMRTQQPGPITK